MLGFPNRIDAATLSGGAWVATLPRANIQTRAIGQVARTVDALLASTVVDIDQGRSRDVRLVSAVGHNFTLGAQYRLRGSNDPTFATAPYDGAWKNVWPEVYPYGTLEWESDSWWDGKYSSDEMAGYNATLVIVLPSTFVLRYWRLEFNDESNPAGYVQIGRIFIGPAWQPVEGASSGLSNAYETKTEVQQTVGGAEIFKVRKNTRITRFTLDFMDLDEGMARAFETDRQAGIDKEVMWVQDPDDTVHAIRRQFLGRFNSLSPLVNPYFSNTSKTYEVKEIV